MQTARFELRNLRHVTVLAEKLNYIRAGEALGLSQSALTRSVQATERELGVRLFDRDRGGVRLTRAGLVFVARAQALLADAERLAAVMQRTANAEEGELQFGIEPLPARALLPAVLSDALGRSPNLRNQALIRSIEALWDLLKRGDIEFFISAEGRIADEPPAKVVRLGHFPLSILVRSGHPILGDEPQPSRFPVLLAGEAGEFEHLPPDLQALVSGPRHIVEDYDLLAKLTQATDAVLVASSVALKQEIAEGSIREVHAHGCSPPQIPIVMYSLDRRSLSPGAIKLARAFQLQMQQPS